MYLFDLSKDPHFSFCYMNLKCGKYLLKLSRHGTIWLSILYTLLEPSSDRLVSCVGECNSMKVDLISPSFFRLSIYLFRFSTYRRCNKFTFLFDFVRRTPGMANYRTQPVIFFCSTLSRVIYRIYNKRPLNGWRTAEYRRWIRKFY